MLKHIDINCDLGEGCGNDFQLLKYITSANIACGFHAGDAATMARVANEAARRKINIGAHVSFFDRDNFGRKKITLPPKEIENIVLYQIGALHGISGRINHVKAHGALYHAASEDKAVALAIGRAAKAFGKLFWIAQASTCQEWAAKKLKIRFAREAFADRGYLPNGMLIPRGQLGALIENPADAARQAVALAGNADTICIHSDSRGSDKVAAAAAAGLRAAGYKITPFK